MSLRHHDESRDKMSGQCDLTAPELNRICISGRFLKTQSAMGAIS